MRHSRNKFLHWLAGHWKRMGAAYLVLIISLLPSLIAYRRAARYALERDRERLVQFVQLSTSAIERQTEP